MDDIYMFWGGFMCVCVNVGVCVYVGVCACVVSETLYGDISKYT